VLQQLAQHRDEEHHGRLSSELEAQEAEHKAIMDQLVKEKLDADRHHRDEVTTPTPSFIFCLSPRQKLCGAKVFLV